MSSKVKKIRAVVGFHGVPDPECLRSLSMAYDGLNTNPKTFPNPPVDLPTVKATLDSYGTLIVDAGDGGKKTISARNKARDTALKQYALNGHYVETVCDDDIALFNSSGYVAMSTTRATPAPLGPVTFRYIDRGPVTGQIEVKVKSQAAAFHYEIRFAIVPAGGAPGPWSTQILTSPKAFTFTDLTPGATYIFQVRAMGRLGFTDWSDSSTFICG